MEIGMIPTYDLPEQKRAHKVLFWPHEMNEMLRIFQRKRSIKK